MMHTEVLYPLDPEFGERHRMQEFRDPDYTGPWAGDDSYLFDERCPKCVAERASGKAEIVSA